MGSGGFRYRRFPVSAQKIQLGWKSWMTQMALHLVPGTNSLGDHCSCTAHYQQLQTWSQVILWFIKYKCVFNRIVTYLTNYMIFLFTYPSLGKWLPITTEIIAVEIRMKIVLVILLTFSLLMLSWRVQLQVKHLENSCEIIFHRHVAFCFIKSFRPNIPYSKTTILPDTTNRNLPPMIMIRISTLNWTLSILVHIYIYRFRFSRLRFVIYVLIIGTFIFQVDQ